MSMRMVDLVCEMCGQEREVLIRDIHHPDYPECCGTTMLRLYRPAVVRKDSIEGGVWIAHGLCNPDGSPRRYDSRSEIALECQKRGLVPWTDVYTEDRTKDARVHDDWLKSGEAQRAKRMRDEARREKRMASR